MKDRPDEDPVLRSARREALLVGIFWLGAFTYTTVYCIVNGYGRTAASLKFVLGFPDWIFWGIVLPWGVCLAFNAWFAFCFVQDEVLEEDEPGEPAADGGPGAAEESSSGGAPGG